MSELGADLDHDQDEYAVARRRIGAQQGQLRGWRPLSMGDVSVVALQVLGMVAGDPRSVGLRVIVAARDPDALAAQGAEAAERALRRRSVLAEGDRFEVVRQGELTVPSGIEVTDDPLSWPFAPLIIHVPAGQLPAIAGLATDEVRG